MVLTRRGVSAPVYLAVAFAVLCVVLMGLTWLWPELFFTDTSHINGQSVASSGIEESDMRVQIKASIEEYQMQEVKGDVVVSEKQRETLRIHVNSSIEELVSPSLRDEEREQIRAQLRGASNEYDH